jgi:hypothetical protein
MRKNRTNKEKDKRSELKRDRKRTGKRRKREETNDKAKINWGKENGEIAEERRNKINGMPRNKSRKRQKMNKEEEIKAKE